MPIGATIGGAAITGGLGYYGARKASKAQAGAAQNALNMQLGMYNEAKGYQQPYMETGKGAIYSLAQLYGIPTPGNPNPGQPFNQASQDAFRNSPDYGARFREGKSLLENQYSKMYGGLRGGNQLRGFVDYAADSGTKGFGDYRDTLMRLAQTGSGAAASLTGAAGQFANMGGNTMMGKGQAEAAGTVGGINAITGAIGGGMNNYMLYNLLNKNNQSSYVPYGYPRSGVSPTGPSMFDPPQGGIGTLPGAPY